MKALKVSVIAATLVVSTVAHALTIGALNKKPSKAIKKLTPLTKYLSAKLGEDVKVIVAPTVDALAKKVKSKEVDLFIDSPFPAAEICDKSGAKYALRRWKKGVSEYNGCVFVKKGGVTSIEGLKGKMLAFEEEDSTSSFVLPMLVLMEAGIKLSPKKSFRDKVAADEIGYTFSKDDDNTIVWVDRGRVAGGGIKTAEVKGDDKFNILKESVMVPRAVVCYAPHVSADVQKKVSGILMAMDSSDDGKKALKSFGKTKKFDAIPGSAADLQKQMLELDSKMKDQLKK